MTTGWVFDERYLWHDTGRAAGFLPAGGPLQPDRHVENGDVKRRLRNLVEVSGLLAHLTPIAPRLATAEELGRVHASAYIERVKSLSDALGGDAGDGETPIGRGSYDIARLAVGGAIEAVDAVFAERVDNAYVLCRPPGHHAMPHQGMGFCVFANTALAAHHALQALDRVAIVDWDVHHGNGTEAIFLENSHVLTISIHQEDLYPVDSGRVEANGAANRNIPLPAGSGWGAYEAAMERVVLPELERFQPELLLIASGYDASAYDPLGRMQLSADAFGDLTRMLLELRLPTVAVHEGGYSPFYVPFCGLATIEALAGTQTGVTDPYGIPRDATGQALLPHQQQAVEAAAA